MSKKKEKKIKRLRKQSIWPQIVEAFIVESAIIIIAVMAVALDFLSDEKDLITASQTTCERIVEQINTSWNSSEQKLEPQAEAQLLSFLQFNSDTIGGISIFDEETNQLASYGNQLTEKDRFFKNFSQEDFNKKGFYFIKFNQYEKEGFVIEADLPSETTKQKRYTLVSIISTLIHTDSTYADEEIYRWMTSPVETDSLWVLLKTGIPGVNIAVQKKLIRKQIDDYLHQIMVIVLAICFAFIVIYEHYKLIIAIANKHKIQKLIYTDSVTGGHNGEYFIEKAGRYARRHRTKNVIVYLRMEKYRNYVTAYGIKEGENLMEDFYKKLLTFIKKRHEYVAHLEKSDFVLLLHYDNEDLLNIRMKVITQALNDCRPSQHLYFTVGACRIITKYDNIEEKISNAGAAISRQTKPTDTIFWFDESMREEQIWERRVEDDMEKALENNEFQVYLQPKYSTKKEQLSAAEALVRWIHPEYGFVSPGRFIPIFEKNGFIIKLDDFMLTEVSKLQAKWLGEGKKLVPISVNVSRAHFSRYDLAEHICSIVDEYKVPHEFIELELTESAFFDDKQVLLDTIKKLKNYGFKVSMDDFGAGYSSLNSLKELPLDIIKLDAQFFRDIEDKKRADLIVCDTIKLAKKLGMQIVAEGIETREQVDFLAEQHCDLIQGFYFAKPLPIEEFEEKAFS